jgi:hypothetical protein
LNSQMVRLLQPQASQNSCAHKNEHISICAYPVSNDERLLKAWSHSERCRDTYYDARPGGIWVAKILGDTPLQEQVLGGRNRTSGESCGLLQR